MTKNTLDTYCTAERLTFYLLFSLSSAELYSCRYPLLNATNINNIAFINWIFSRVKNNTKHARPSKNRYAINNLPSSKHPIYYYIYRYLCTKCLWIFISIPLLLTRFYRRGFIRRHYAGTYLVENGRYTTYY